MPRRRKDQKSSSDEENECGLTKSHHPIQRHAANERERCRMRVLSKAFSKLKTTLPWVPSDTKLSKLDTLRLASSYIAHLKQILDGDDEAITCNPSTVHPMNLVNPVLSFGVVLCVTFVTLVRSDGVTFTRNYYYEGIDLGKFPGGAPFNNVGIFRPQSPGKINVQFFLYTRNNRDSLQNIKPSSITSSNFDAARRTIFWIHGYSGSCNMDDFKTLKNELLDKDDFNVICVDWSRGATSFFYEQAASNTRVAGAIVAVMIDQLNSQANAQLNNIHIIGHSLGAHTAGYAGAKRQVDRITGLDPAGPAFRNTPPVVRLDPSDANYVDVIHTDGKSLMQGGLGMLQECGDADFYPNGGTDQPGCPSFSGKSIFSGIANLIDSVVCNHVRATEFFTESINSDCPFTACNDVHCTRMGYYADLDRTPGNYSLTTNAQSPFCITKTKKKEESYIERLKLEEARLKSLLEDVV